VTSFLITLVVVLAILFVYRRLDKGNIKLNKVRQYVEHVLNDLKEYERKKKEEIRVQETRLDELLNRAETLNRSVETKVASVAEEEEKVRRSAEAVEATGVQVRELLNRIDGVNKSMDDLGEKARVLASVDEHIQNLRKQMERLDREVRTSEQKMMAGLQEKHREVNEQFVQKVEQLRSQVLLTESKLSAKIAAEHDSLKIVIKRIKDTFSFSEKNLRDQMDKVRRQVPLFFQKVTEDLSLRKEEMLKETLEKVRLFNEAVKDIEATHLNNKNQMIESFRAGIRVAETEIEAERKKFHDSFLEVRQDALDRLKSFQDVLAAQEKTSGLSQEKNREEMEKLLGEVRRMVQSAGGEFERLKKDACVRFDQQSGLLRAKLEEKEEKLYKSFQDKIAGLAAKANELTEKFNEEKKTLQKAVNEKIAELNRRTTESLKTIGASEKNAADAVGAIAKDGRTTLAGIEKNALELVTQKTAETTRQYAGELDDRIARLRELMDGCVADLQTRSEEIRRTFQEDQSAALENLAGRLSGVDTEYAEKLKGLQKQFVDFEARVSKNVNRDISDFTEKLTAVTGQYRKTEETLLRETRDKIGQAEVRLAEYGQKVENAEKEYERKLEEKFRDVDGSMSGRMTAFQTRLAEREKKFMEKSKEDLDKISLNIRRLEGLLKENESSVKQSSKEVLKSFQTSLGGFRKQAEESAEAFLAEQKDKAADLERQVEERLKNADGLLAKMMEESRKKTEERASKLAEDFAALKQSARTEVQSFIADFRKKLGDLVKTYNELESKGKNLEKNFHDAIKGQVEGFTQRISAKIEEFQARTKTAEKTGGQAMREFLDGLRQEYDQSRQAIQAQAQEFMLAETKKIDDLTDRVNETKNQLDYFLQQTQVFDTAQKLKEDLKSSIAQFKKDIQQMKDERTFLTTVENRVKSIRDQGEKLEKMVESLSSERRRTEQVERQVQDLMQTVKEVNERMDTFKKDQSRIGELSERFRKLDQLVKKVNTNIEAFAGRESDLETYARTLDRVATNYNSLEQRSESQAQKIQDVENRGGKLDRELKDLGDRISLVASKEGQLNSAIEKIGELEGVTAFVDEKFNQIKGMRPVVDKALEELKERTQDAEELLKDIVSTLEDSREATGRFSDSAGSGRGRTAEREPSGPTVTSADMIRKVKGLDGHNYTPEKIADVLGISVQTVRDILKKG
jgi:chromosome segregation ATPase